MYLSQMERWGDLIPGWSKIAMSPEVAMTHSAVYAAVRIIAGTIAMMPLHTFERVDDDESRRVKTDAALLLSDRPNSSISATMFWRAIVASMLLQGNGYAWIERTRGNVIKGIWFLPKDHCRPRRLQSGAMKGRVVYRIRVDGADREVDQDDILHFPGTMELDQHGIEAKTPIRAYADAVGIGLKANDFADKFFDKDATPPGYIKYPTGKAISSFEQQQALIDQWVATTTGPNRHRPGLLTEGGDFVQLKISASDAQLLDTRRFQIEDVGRIFGVPPHLLGAVDKVTNWGTGLSEQTNGFLMFCLGPHMRAIETELNYKLFRFEPKPVFAEFERKALVSLDIDKRFTAYRGSLGGSSGPGFMSVNEVRKRENLPPIADPRFDKPQVWEPTAAKAPAGDPETKEPSESGDA